MSELILIRHAQASFGHENYDNLSELGHDQATLLGSLFDSLNISPDRVVIGTQKRHLQTLENFNLKCQYFAGPPNTACISEKDNLRRGRTRRNTHKQQTHKFAL